VSGLGIATAKTLLSRKGAQAGDVIFVTGTLGGSSSGKHLRFLPRLPESQWLVQHSRPSAMMDLSDGLGKDLPRLALASRVSFRIKQKDLPRSARITADQAVNDGEDYELLFTIPKSRALRLEKSWPFSTRLTRIGEILSSRQSPDTDGLVFRGFDHLAGKSK
jgi:thiamine-monophosphate kinase